jgi:hypothetical protein
LGVVSVSMNMRPSGWFTLNVDKAAAKSSPWG